MIVKLFQSFLVVIILTIPNGEIFGQSGFREGFIITNSNDTLPGYLDYGLGIKLHNSLRFRSNEDSAIQDFLPKDLKRFRFLNDKLYKSIYIEEDAEFIFAEVLVEGRVTLSKIRKSYYLEKDGDSILYNINGSVEESYVDGEVKTNRKTRNVGIIKSLLSDSKISANIDKIGITERKLTELIDEYNSSFGNSLAYKEDKQWVRLQVGATLGLANSFLKIDGFTLGTNFSNFSEFNYSLQPLYGISFFLSRPRNSERLGFYAEVLFTQSEYSANNSSQVPYVGQQYLSMSVNSLKIPIAFRSMLSNQEFGPFLNLGLVYYNHFNSNSNRIDEVRGNNEVVTIEMDGLRINKSEFGVWAGLGLNRAITSKSTGHLELRYELSNGIVSDFNTGPGMLQYDYGGQRRGHFNLVLGFQFK